MDPELLQLQRLFEATQQSKASVRLSERNIVELVTKLQELHLLESNLLHTVSGKEYLTQGRLRHEMELEIRRLGRVSLIEAANLIGVDLFYCEREAESIVAAHTDLMLVQGEVISTGYWDVVAEEINESLQEAGQVALADLAARLNVGSELLTTMLEPRMGNLIHGKLEGGQLYTQAYVTRIRAMIRGAVRALMIPTNLSTVWDVLQQQLIGTNGGSGVIIGEGKLFQSLFNGLLKEEAFSGTLRGGGAVWIPATASLKYGSSDAHLQWHFVATMIALQVFEKAQHEGVESFYSQNSYATYDILRRLAISQPKQFLQGKYANGIALDSVFIHSSLINMVDAAVDEAVDGGGWIDCVSLVPSIFSSLDVSKLVSLCPSVQRAEKESRALTLAETCVISSGFLKAVSEKLENEVRELAKTTAVTDLVPRSSQHNSGTGILNTVNSDDKEVNIKGNSSQVKFSKKKGATRSLDDAEDEYVSGKGSRSKKKGGKGKSGNSELGSSNKGGKVNIEKQTTRADEMLSEDYIASRILENFPDLEGAGTDEEGEGALSKAMAVRLKPTLVSTWEKVKQASFTAAAEEWRERAENLQKTINELYANLQLFTKALDIFDDDNTSLPALHRHLLRTTASELVDAILHIQELERRLENGDTCADFSSTTIPLSTPQKFALAKGFRSSLAAKCMKLVESLDGKNVAEFNLALQNVADECGLRLKLLDKKSEKALLSSYKKGLSLEIEKENDPVALLPKVVALLFVQVHNKALQAPGRALSAAINHLKNRISDEVYKTLSDYQINTVALLSMLSTSTPGGTDCTSSRVEEKQEQLLTMMPNLKQIFAASQ